MGVEERMGVEEERMGDPPSLLRPLHVGVRVKSLFPHPWKSKRGALTLAVIKLRGNRDRGTVSTSIGSHDLWYTTHLVLSLPLSIYINRAQATTMWCTTLHMLDSMQWSAGLAMITTTPRAELQLYMIKYIT